jgi:Protein of unknown function (DUF2510)
MSDSTNGVPPVPRPSTPPAGWYDDGSGRQRYWDGNAWTDHFADAQRTAQPTGAAAAQPAGAGTSRTGLWITIGVVGGLLLLVLIGGIIAAAVGLVSRIAEELPDIGTPTAPAEQNEEPGAEPAPDPPAGAETAVFGETRQYTDGLAVTVSEPRPFEPSETGLAGEATAYVVFDVTVANGSDQPYEPFILASVQSGNLEAEEVFDSGSGLQGTPSTTVLPGREVRFQIGYGVADPADLVLQITPGFDYERAIYVSSR